MKGNKELAVLFTVLTVMGTVSVAFALKTKDNAIQSANFNYKINSSTSSKPITKTRTKAKSSTVVSNKEESTPVSSEPKAITTHHDAPDGKYYIEMKNILQKPELPTGCEATALAIVLNYLGFSADKCDIVDNYLPKTNSMCSLNNFFIGNPYSKSGLGCYAPVIVKTADSYLSRAGSQYRAQLLTGSDPETLYWYVSQNVPVMCWVTIGMVKPKVGAVWTAKDTGEKMQFMENEHCTVLVGYNSTKGTVMLNDPWKGKVTYSMSLFEKRYRELGKQAVIIR
ncbi:C39 family peptidase [Thermocaproicibacter melissae]|uniref:C39 family peptidase n=1 Tax=Thermocaproicibacter melissae TaxID=2966552 RepID=UPI0024B06544|nr:C39 family peptidase [Thermocaproicibacter melissae]WBY63792.1 C39 family peptidase [Thermocaproicibacter melissae]